MESIITTPIANNVLEQITSVISSRRNFDSTIKNFRTIVLSPSDIQYFKKIFYYNHGSMSDGKKIRLQEKDIYFKFNVNFSLLEENELSYIKNSFERFDIEKPSVIVYINGYKIPDKEIFFYSTSSSTDIMIPEHYINDGEENILFVEKREYINKEYINYHSPSFSGTSLIVPINNEQYSNVNINSYTVMIFVDKKLYTGTRTILKSPTSISISFGVTLSNNEIEVFVDSSIKYYNAVYFENTRFISYNVPEYYIDPIHGPLSKNSCLFFLDGLRISSTDITQTGRLHFNFTYTESTSVTAAIYVSDREYIEDSKKINYGSDYYLYNMIGSSEITKALRNFPTNTIFDGNISYSEVLNHNGTKYDRTYIDQVVKTFNSMTQVNTKVSYLLTGRPYLMRSFLEQYKKNVYSYSVYYNGIQSSITIGVSITIDPKIQNEYIININNNHVSNNNFTTIRKGVTDIFEIPGSYFKPGNNIVNITVLDGKYSLVYQKVLRTDIIVDESIHYTGDSKFDNKYYLEDDIIIFEKIENDSNYIYINEENIGYKIKKDVSIIKELNNRPTIIFHTMPDNDIIIYCKRFVYTYVYTKEITNTQEDVFVPLYIGSETDPIPFISDNKMEVYAGKIKLIPGIDYFLKNQTNEETLSYSLLIIKRILDPYLEINVYYTNVENRILMKRKGYIENNNYGLFYLDLPFPVSLQYLNIYLNGRILDYSDIDILSDKLIRVHSFQNPMYDLSVETAFSVSYNSLEPYFYLYEPDTFEQYISELFRTVNYSRNINLDDSPPDVNSIYEGFISTVDSTGKVPNPVAREDNWFAFNETTQLGVINDGSAMGNSSIRTSNILSNILFVAGDNGRVASCDILTNTWYSYDYIGSNHIANNGNAILNNHIYTSQIFENKLVIMGANANIAYVNLLTGEWTASNTLGGLNLRHTGTTVFLGSIYSSIVYQDRLLIIAGEAGRVASYNIETDEWCSYSKKLSGFISDIGTAMGGSTIRTMKIDTSTGNKILVVAGDNGRVASCYLDNGGWTTHNGTYPDVFVNGPNVFSNGSHRNNLDIYSTIKFGANIVFFGESGAISVFNLNSNSWFSYDSINTFNLTSTGNYVNFKDIYDVTNFGTSYIITGGDDSIMSSYNGSVIQWDYYNGDIGIVNNGSALGGLDIYSMITYDNTLAYIIASGEAGRVASYNIDIHEVPFRFDPYKTAFLLWYITGGNVEVKIPYEIPEALIQQFKIYKDLDISKIYDIVVRSSDTDLTQSVTMNEGDAYPYQFRRRTQFVAEFVQSLTDMRLTPQMVYDLYKDKFVKNILYLEDLRPLVSGDELEGEEDIILHLP